MNAVAHPFYPILLVDDEASSLDSFELALKSMGINNALPCRDSRRVMSILAERDIEVILLDLMMPHLSGEEILTRVNEEYPWIPVIVITGLHDLDSAVTCMKKGAYDYIVKPVKKDRLEASLRRAVEMRQLRRENSDLSRRVLEGRLEYPEAFADIITQNAAMHSIFRYCEAIARGAESVLITGETGVGKELIARSLHRVSQRPGPFVPVNAAGLDDNMFSDTLFGHTKGAYTGAIQTRPGLIEKAAGGTLFLDEIGDLPPASQIRLLRLIQEREYYPLGSDMAKPSTARVLAATNQDINELIENGRFRKDLYYRLGTHQVDLPPLRRRFDDLPVLLDSFLEAAASEYGKNKPTYHPELLHLLATYDFPGNIRELKSMVHDAVAVHTSRMLSMDVFRSRIFPNTAQESFPDNEAPASESAPNWLSGLSKLPTLKEASDLIIAEAMRRAGNNQRLAASMIGLSHQALNKRLKRQGD